MRYHWCVRVYNNDERKIEVRSEQQLAEWLEYNRTARFGNALFVDGACVATGYLGEERCKGWEEKLIAEFAKLTQEELQRTARASGRQMVLTGYRNSMGTAARAALLGSALVSMGEGRARSPQQPIPTRPQPRDGLFTINLGRNAPCRCGSGKKSKRCCVRT